MKTLNRICSHVSASLAAARLPCFLVCEWQTEGRAGSPDARGMCSSAAAPPSSHTATVVSGSSTAGAGERQEREDGRWHAWRLQSRTVVGHAISARAMRLREARE